MLKLGKRKLKILRVVLFIFVLLSFINMTEIKDVYAGMPNISINLTSEGGDQTSSVLQVLFIFIVLALLPTVLLMMTSFTRIIIVLHFLRSALGTQQMPPNQIIVGISLILSLFIMRTPLDQIYNEAYLPYSNAQISTEEFSEKVMEPLRGYMFQQVASDDLGLFAKIAGVEINSATPMDEIPSTILIPAYVIGELTKGFEMGFWLYVPFIVIDMVVASVLMAMGMMMLPPAMISLPFKILIFINSDGWREIISNIVSTFSMTG